MRSPGRSDYLESKIMTASGPQLHLMLVEGAIRFVKQADEQYLANNEGKATTMLLRAMDVVEEMIAGVRHDDHEVNIKLSQLYAFLYRTMTSVYVNSDREKLADVVRILEFQRETWRLACEHLAKSQASVTDTPAKTPVVPTPHTSLSTTTQSVSLEA
jgi:flagellar protein FliS